MNRSIATLQIKRELLVYCGEQTSILHYLTALLITGVQFFSVCCKHNVNLCLPQQKNDIVKHYDSIEDGHILLKHFRTGELNKCDNNHAATETIRNVH
jgi:hypothetical protein